MHSYTIIDATAPNCNSCGSSRPKFPAAWQSSTGRSGVDFSARARARRPESPPRKPRRPPARRPTANAIPCAPGKPPLRPCRAGPARASPGPDPRDPLFCDLPRASLLLPWACERRRLAERGSGGPSCRSIARAGDAGARRWGDVVRGRRSGLHRWMLRTRLTQGGFHAKIAPWGVDPCCAAR